MTQLEVGTRRHRHPGDAARGAARGRDARVHPRRGGARARWSSPPTSAIWPAAADERAARRPSARTRTTAVGHPGAGADARCGSTRPSRSAGGDRSTPDALRGERAPEAARPDRHRPHDHHQDQRQHRRLAGVEQHRRGGREAPLGAALRRRHADGPVDRRRPRRLPPGDHRPRDDPDRHGADLQHDHRPADRGPQLRRHPARGRAPGAAGRRLLHHPRRRAARAPAAGRSARHRHRVARRLAARQVDDPPRQAEPDVRAVRRDQRHHARVRRDLLARRRAAAGLPRRRDATRRSSPSCARSASWCSARAPPACR